ncbi:hypothetical protein EBZ39_09870 [bacterium]|nr:hypothetical protein [bacterium]
MRLSTKLVIVVLYCLLACVDKTVASGHACKAVMKCELIRERLQLELGYLRKPADARVFVEAIGSCALEIANGVEDAFHKRLVEEIRNNYHRELRNVFRSSLRTAIPALPVEALLAKPAPEQEGFLSLGLAYYQFISRNADRSGAEWLRLRNDFLRERVSQLPSPFYQPADQKPFSIMLMEYAGLSSLLETGEVVSSKWAIRDGLLYSRLLLICRRSQGEELDEVEASLIS